VEHDANVLLLCQSTSRAGATANNHSLSYSRQPHHSGIWPHKNFAKITLRNKGQLANPNLLAEWTMMRHVFIYYYLKKIFYWKFTMTNTD